MKTKLRSGLFYGILMALFFTIQNIYREDNLTTQNIFRSIILGLFTGAIAGLLFGLLTGLFMKSKFIKQTVEFEKYVGEEILFETPANHFKGMEAVGGKLFLTNKRLVFNSHKLNVQNHQLAIDLNNINCVDRYKTLGLINNGLIITTKQNTSEKFVVDQAKQWINKLENEKVFQHSVA